MTFNHYMDILVKVNNIYSIIDVKEKIKFINSNGTYVSLSIFDIAYKIENRNLMMKIINDKNFNINDDLIIYYLNSRIEFNITNSIPLLKQIIFNKDYEILSHMLKRNDLNVNIKDCKYTSILSWLLNISSYDENIINMLFKHNSTNLDIPDVDNGVLKRISKLSNFNNCCYRSFTRNKISVNLLPYVSKYLYSSEILSLIVLISDNYLKIK